MRGKHIVRSACVIFAGLVLINPLAHAQFEEGTLFAEVFAGSYAPEPDALDDESTFGVRFGGMMTERVAVVGSLGQVEFEDTATDGATSVKWDSEITLLDVTVAYVFRPTTRLAIAAGGGIGHAFTSFDGELQTPTLRARFEDLDEDSLTLNAILGPVITLSSRIYLKPLIRARWFEVREDDEVDIESSLALGFKW